ncbi:MAG: T9SS type A sorting domain-containing protein, partial [Bacteroidales bacterium]|nr:T9SS type A sorting domain-containing protein [Bacteroidales bacterium]
PVIFLLHGLGDNCNNFSTLHFEDVAPNWIIITPEATNATISILGSSMSAGTAWAAGVGGENITYMGFPLGNIELNEGVNDDGFILAILDSLENNFNVDTDSVFVAGFSMGGFMSNKMAIKHADRITAIASVSGTIGHFQPFEPTGNINTMHIHGTADETISYDNANFDFNGIAIPVGIGADSLVKTWREYNQCAAEPTVYQYVNSKEDNLTFEQYTYKNEETGNKTVFIKVNNGIHTWYDGYNNDIDYNREIYNFFIGKEPESFTLTSSSGENGSISPDGEIAVNESQYYAFTITPDEGYRIESVIVDAETENEANVTNAIVNSRYTFQNVMANHSINVTFEEIPTYTISSSAGENGTISPEGDTIVYEGTNATFTITPDEGYRIASVIVDAETENEANVTNAIVNSRYTFQNVMANHSINVTFEEIPTYTISSSAGENGTISPEGDTIVYEGTNATFTITPDEGYRIASVIVDAETENEANVTDAIVNSTYTFRNVMANHSIYVTFEVIPNDNIDINTADNFSIYPNPATDIVNIVSQNDSELAIFNATGKEIKRINTIQNNTIDISDLPNGMYFIVIDGHAQKLTIAR